MIGNHQHVQAYFTVSDYFPSSYKLEKAAASPLFDLNGLGDKRRSCDDAVFANAYITGLEQRLAAGKDIRRIASVASFFLSRIDLLVDPLLEQKGRKDLQGQAAIASAKAAFSLYRRIFSGERWQKLADAGAKPQRLLRASTGNKNPAFRDTRYVEELIGPDTVNTVPLGTIDAFRDHGEVGNRLELNPEQAIYQLENIAEAGVDLEAVAVQLEKEGIEKFEKPYQKLLSAIREKTDNDSH